jgi:hypothetical protein
MVGQRVARDGACDSAYGGANVVVAAKEPTTAMKGGPTGGWGRAHMRWQ